MGRVSGEWVRGMFKETLLVCDDRGILDFTPPPCPSNRGVGQGAPLIWGWFRRHGLRFATELGAVHFYVAGAT
jgi:hypothetical protein